MIFEEIKKEALCSSCKLKPEKFHVRQENMMTSTYRRGMLSYLPYQVFSGPQLEDVDTYSSTLLVFLKILFGAGRCQRAYE